MAAAERGVAVQVQTFPDGEPAADRLPGGRTVARLVLGRPGSATPDPLFAQVRRRHTHKGVYDNARAVPQALAATWLSSAQAAGLRAGVVDDAQRCRRCARSRARPTRSSAPRRARGWSRRT